jgi:hypothetical protein
MCEKAKHYGLKSDMILSRIRYADDRGYGRRGTKIRGQAKEENMFIIKSEPSLFCERILQVVFHFLKLSRILSR